MPVSLSPVDRAELLPAELYLRVFEHAPVGMLVYVWDSPPDVASFRLIAQNVAATRIGSAPEELGRPIAENERLLHSEVPARYAKVIEDAEPAHWEIDWVHPSGVRTHYDVQCFPVDRRHIVVFFTDATEKKAAQQSLAQRLRELERSNRELDDFAYVASHDLKSPLRDIDNLAAWLAEDLGSDLPPDSARHIRVLRERVGRMERLLDELLEYSRAGREAALHERVILRDIVEEVQGLLRPAHHEIVLEPGLADLDAPRTAVMVVVRNLVANAIKHDDRPSGRIYVTATEDDGFVVLSVRDEGPGIPARFHERAFRLFQTLRPRDQTGTTGMGLAIVKKIVENLGGHAHIDSNGRGTTVRTFWPKSQRMTPPTATHEETR